MPLFQTPTVEGTLTLGEKTIALKFAYAFERVNDEDLPPKAELHLVLSDQPLPPEALEGVFGLHMLQQDGKVQGVEFNLSQKDPARNFSGQLYPAPPESVSSFTVSNRPYFSSLTLSGGRVAGKVASEQEKAPSPQGESIPYRYEASFSVPVQKAPPVTKLLKGKAAQAHPFVALMARYFATVRKGDYAGMQKLVTQGTLASWARLEKQMGAEQYRKQLAEFGKQATFDPKAITHLVLRGERATVVSKIKGGKDIAGLRRENGAWKLHLL